MPNAMVMCIKCLINAISLFLLIGTCDPRKLIERLEKVDIEWERCGPLEFQVLARPEEKLTDTCFLDMNNVGRGERDNLLASKYSPQFI